jgi:hypothetical protein
MGKKKKARKKVHRSRSSSGAGKPEQASISAPALAAATAAPPAPASASSTPSSSQPLPNRVRSGAQLSSGGRWAYVQTDLRRVGILILTCIVLEAVLWLLFNHTGIGTTIYNQIKL